MSSSKVSDRLNVSGKISSWTMTANKLQLCLANSTSQGQSGLRLWLRHSNQELFSSCYGSGKSSMDFSCTGMTRQMLYQHAPRYGGNLVVSGWHDDKSIPIVAFEVSLSIPVGESCDISIVFNTTLIQTKSGLVIDV